ncbi:MAG: hypothetical protein ABFC95_02420 [Smithella sp.]
MFNKKKSNRYHLYGVMNGVERNWGCRWKSRDAALDKANSVCADNSLWVGDVLYRDDPHRHEEVLICTDPRYRFFIDRV